MNITIEAFEGEVVARKRDVVLSMCAEMIDRLEERQNDLSKGATPTIKLHPVQPLNTMRGALLDAYKEQMEAMNRHIVRFVEAVQAGKTIDLDKILAQD